MEVRYKVPDSGDKSKLSQVVSKPMKTLLRVIITIFYAN
jgi:hypothetical protein